MIHFLYFFILLLAWYEDNLICSTLLGRSLDIESMVTSVFATLILWHNTAALCNPIL
ncbi:Uncharacterized protein YR821_1505 [Yersinia ruckeri]|uniref:Uncharacterized protein n=1 Tax=Yersinia ruckeri TaxID=29486 RepID=A0A0A8VIA8_YERRU|nr:hypothetical protein yruck0001_16360 [Yersinia ruckeri ATCC 29473]QTD76430.1 Uncharacterized protein YR821_1505 [Yersinia ruckeri]CEK27331.1 hypothetical protein CSF007_7875 [Yersinia ruckeri]